MKFIRKLNTVNFNDLKNVLTFTLSDFAWHVTKLRSVLRWSRHYVMIRAMADPGCNKKHTQFGILNGKFKMKKLNGMHGDIWNTRTPSRKRVIASRRRTVTLRCKNLLHGQIDLCIFTIGGTNWCGKINGWISYFLVKTVNQTHQLSISKLTLKIVHRFVNKHGVFWDTKKKSLMRCTTGK